MFGKLDGWRRLRMIFHAKQGGRGAPGMSKKSIAPGAAWRSSPATGSFPYFDAGRRLGLAQRAPLARRPVAGPLPAGLWLMCVKYAVKNIPPGNYSLYTYFPVNNFTEA